MSAPRNTDKKSSRFGVFRIVMLLSIGLFIASWLSTRDTGAVLKYGEFKRLMDAPGVHFRNVKVSKTEIRGEILTQDRFSGYVPGSEKEEASKDKEPVNTITTAAQPFRTVRQGLETDDKLVPMLDKRLGAAYQGDDEDVALKGVGSVVSSLIMILIMLGIMGLTFRWLSGGQSPLSFGRSRHKLYAQKENKITFADVAGIDEAVEELREVVDFLKKPDKYQALGGRIPKGVLLVGTPGTGKTLLAKAVAGEAEVPFFSLSGSDFVEMFVGVGAARVRDLFRDAEQKAPCIIFIDELDAMGKSRGVAAVGHDEREQTLNQLLVEMDGFESNKGVIIMAATNRPETLDQALLRPGRFDRTVVVDQPDIDGREAILKVHARNVKLDVDVNLRRVAALTPGSVGADLANLVNEAALLAARKDKKTVSMSDFSEAIEREAIGLERKSRIMTPVEKKRIAYHEAGHAIVAVALHNSDPVHKVSIIPRGVGTGGYVLSRPDEDRHLLTRSMLETKIQIALGGTIAEELVFVDISTGATSDLNQCNRIACAMVREFGMSKLGRVYLRDKDGASFLPGMDMGSREYSEETAREVDLEVRHIIDAATEAVRDILRSRRDVLDVLAEKLVEIEVLEGDALHELLATHGLIRPKSVHEQNGMVIAPSPVELETPAVP